ncbi:SAM-dependent methyltransferase [Dissulfurispira thermophila]|uniref:SAM-dependent methyltransferase n=2 Tax=Dissulfurispira thermophila TaxID=2715679 RepID=A0A7G1H316_9BACT|nr:SAM-dependent methyltransferase [Dissulfurispira thermophila]
MSSLKQKIIEKIRSEGPINFETFMEMTLYYPCLGYYTKDSAKIGRTGDFYTSPHLHSIFGAMIGKQMMEMWELIGRPEIFHVVEMGAGMGYLAKDMLEYLSGSKSNDKRQKDIFEHLKYTIVELNLAVKTKQQELLSEFMDKVNWISNLNELESVTGCFLSNELLDAFPVRLVEMDNEIKEIYVSLNGDDFVEIKMPCTREVEEYFREFGIELPKGFRTEANLKIKSWLKEVSNKLFKGFVLTIDYGYPAEDYYIEDRNRGTLLCYHQHQINENPYQNIGEQDLTAHVNFSSLKKWGDELGLKTIGFCPQGTYLVSLGIDEVINEIYGDSPDFFEIAKIKGLILPQGMGESHKVMVQYKGDGEPILRGFALRNQKGKLEIYD